MGYNTQRRDGSDDGSESDTIVREYRASDTAYELQFVDGSLRVSVDGDTRYLSASSAVRLLMEAEEPLGTKR